MNQISVFEALLSKRIPMPPNLPVTFLEIAQVPHYEVVISRIYQFYLQDSEEHGFKDLFLGALMALINQKWKTHTSTEILFFPAQPARWEVQIEVVTQKGNRIDILIEWEADGQKHCIVIENKIFHILLNDLTDYFNTPKASAKHKIGVLLTLDKQAPNHEHFVNITHEEWLGEVKKRIGEYLMTGVDRHLFFIRDFILNLSKLTKNTEYMSEFAQFYFEHRTSIEQLVEARNSFIQQVFSAYETAGRQLGLEIGLRRTGYYQYLIKERGEVMFTLLFHDKKSSAFSIAYEVQGKKLPFKEALREYARTLINSDRWSKVWVNTWGNASCAHIVGISYPLLGKEQEDIVGFFEKELKETWLPLSEALNMVYEKTG